MTDAAETPIISLPNSNRFENLIGHDSVIEYLRKAHRLNKLPQTILFDGPSGIGKSSMAYALAKFLLAGGQDDSDVYQKHARKVEMQPPIHPDLRMLTPSGAGGQIKVDDVRDAIDVAFQMPIESDRRVIIIDPADRLNVSAANSLLKLLEEPPSLLTLILATESVHGILPTIRSRSARLRLYPLSSELIVRWLEKSHGIDPQLARVAALFSDGCPGKALQQIGGKAVADRDTLIREWQFFQAHGFQAIFRVAWNLAGITQPLETLLGAWTTWLRDSLVAATTPQRHDLLVNSDRMEDLAEEAQRLGPRVIGRCLEHLVQARLDARRLINRQLFFEALLLRLGPELKRS